MEGKWDNRIPQAARPSNVKWKSLFMAVYK
jgi:hypothetical protein